MAPKLHLKIYMFKKSLASITIFCILFPLSLSLDNYFYPAIVLTIRIYIHMYTQVCVCIHRCVYKHICVCIYTLCINIFQLLLKQKHDIQTFLISLWVTLINTHTPTTYIIFLYVVMRSICSLFWVSLSVF